MTICLLASVTSVLYISLAFISAMIVVPIIQAVQKIKLFEESISAVFVVGLCQLCLIGLLYLVPDGLLSHNTDSAAIRNNNFVLTMLPYAAFGISLLIVTLFGFIVWLFRSGKKRHAIYNGRSVRDTNG